MGKGGAFLSARSLLREANNKAAATAADPIAAPAIAAAPLHDPMLLSSFLLTTVTPLPCLDLVLARDDYPRLNKDQPSVRTSVKWPATAAAAAIAGLTRWVRAPGP